MDYNEAVEIICLSLGCSLDEFLMDIEPLDEDMLFRDMVDETHELIEICGMNYSPSRVLFECDPAGYRGELHGYIDSLESDDIIVSFDNGANHYMVSDVEELIEKHDELLKPAERE